MKQLLIITTTIVLSGILLLMPFSSPQAFGGTTSTTATGTIDPDCGMNVTGSSLALGAISNGDPTITGTFTVQNTGTIRAIGSADAGVYAPPTTRTGGFTGDSDGITHIAPDETSLDADDGGTGNLGDIGLLNSGSPVTFIALNPLSVEGSDRTVNFNVGNANASPSGVQIVELPYDGQITQVTTISTTCQ